jgi:hypothetical protein
LLENANFFVTLATKMLIRRLEVSAFCCFAILKPGVFFTQTRIFLASTDSCFLISYIADPVRNKKFTQSIQKLLLSMDAFCEKGILKLYFGKFLASDLCYFF